MMQLTATTSNAQVLARNLLSKLTRQSLKLQPPQSSIQLWSAMFDEQLRVAERGRSALWKIIASRCLTNIITVATVIHANRVRSGQRHRKLAKHGVSLALAGELDWEAALVWIDDRFEYDELRMIALAPKTEILYYVAFVDHGEVRRPISLRRANRREVKHYVQSI